MFNNFKYLVYGLLVFVLSAFAQAQTNQVTFSKVQVSVNKQTYPLEYAVTHAQRAQGLMHRESMCETCGMLFNFQNTRQVNMWMKNTLIPLDVAFIRADGFIVNIETMQPRVLKTTSSAGEVLYAWEMNQGWFAKNGIGVGDTVSVKE